MRPRELAVWPGERRKRSDELDVVGWNVIGRETEDAFYQWRSDDRSDGNHDDDYEAEHCEFILEQPSPRVAPQRRAVNKLAGVRMHVFGDGFFWSDLDLGFHRFVYW
jgi:hypothetical protein